MIKLNQALLATLIMALTLSSTSGTKAQNNNQSEIQNAKQLTITTELKAAIDAGGVNAAKKRFAEIYPSRKDKYHYDSQAFMALVTAYMNSGKVKEAMVLAEINAQLSQDMVRQQMAASSPEMLELLDQHQQAVADVNKQKQAEEQSNQLAQTTSKNQLEKKLRTDLNRFTGLYGTESPHRQLWVSQTCEGQLVVGATWGDASPWWMTTVTDTKFTYTGSFKKLAIEFKLGSNNQAIELSHDLEKMTNPLVRTGPLTEDYQACIKPFVR